MTEITPQSQVGNQSTPEKLTDWELRWKTDTLNSLFDTVKNVFLNPGSYFTGMSAIKDVLPMLIYIYALTLVGSITGLIIQVGWELGVSGGENLFILPVAGFALFAAPIGTIVGSFIAGGLMHLGVVYIGGSKKSYMHTMQVVGYSSATSVWGFIPVVGQWIHGIHQLVLSIIGLKHIHNISWPSAILSGLIPTALFCCCFGSIMFFLAGSIAALSQMGQ